MRSVILTLLLWSGLLGAADPALPTEARWVLRVDIEALKAAPETMAWGDAILAAPEVAPKLAAVALLTGFDLRGHLRGLWLAGAGPEQEKAVLIGEGTFDRERLVAIIQLAKGYRMTPYRDLQIHSWHDDGQNRLVHTCFLTPELLAFSGSSDSLTAVIDAHQAGGAIGGPLGDWLAESRGAIIAGAVIGLADIAGLPPRAAILKNGKDLFLRLDERGGLADLVVRLDATDVAAATRLVDLLKGIKAMVELGADPAAHPVLEALLETSTLERTGTRLELHATCPVALLRRQAEEQVAREAAAAEPP